jgi:hypothetical protein
MALDLNFCGCTCIYFMWGGAVGVVAVVALQRAYTTSAVVLALAPEAGVLTVYLS